MCDAMEIFNSKQISKMYFMELSWEMASNYVFSLQRGRREVWQEKIAAAT